MDVVENTIKDSLKKIPSKAKIDNWKGEAPWTTAVKQVLVDVGKCYSWLTAANGCKSDDGAEWLCDVVWYQLDKAGHFSDICLVAESEWGSEKEIKADFEKLLVMRAKYRVMIFQSGTDDDINRIMGNMILWISKFHGTTNKDRYLFIGWAKDHWVFRHYVVGCD